MGNVNSIALCVLGLCAAAWALRNLWRAGRGESPSQDPLLNAATIGVGVSLVLWFLPEVIEDFPEEVFTGLAVSDAVWMCLFFAAACRYSSTHLRRERE